jgi:hypothetical protein
LARLVCIDAAYELFQLHPVLLPLLVDDFHAIDELASFAVVLLLVVYRTPENQADRAKAKKNMDDYWFCVQKFHHEQHVFFMDELFNVVISMSMSEACGELIDLHRLGSGVQPHLNLFPCRCVYEGGYGHTGGH